MWLLLWHPSLSLARERARALFLPRAHHWLCTETKLCVSLKPLRRNQQQLELRRQQQEMQLQQQINAILSLTAESARADDHLIYGPRAVLPWANPENVEQARQDFSNSARAMVLLTLSHYRAKRQRDAAAATPPRQPLAPLIETSDESAASTAASKEQSQPEEQHGLRMQAKQVPRRGGGVADEKGRERVRGRGTRGELG